MVHNELLLIQEGLLGLINVVNIHNHTVGTAASLAHLRPSDNLHLQFMSYFDNGLGVADAMRHHADNMLLDDGVDEIKLADGSLNPKHTTARNWFDKWRLTNLGPRTGDQLFEVYSLHVISVLPRAIFSALSIV